MIIIKKTGLTGKPNKGFTSINKNSTNYIRQRWEKEANVIIEQKTWLQVWETQCISTNLWKNLICFFGTRYQKSRFSGSLIGGSVDQDWSCPHAFLGRGVGHLVSEILDLKSDL